MELLLISAARLLRRDQVRAADPLYKVLPRHIGRHGLQSQKSLHSALNHDLTNIIMEEKGNEEQFIWLPNSGPLHVKKITWTGPYSCSTLINFFYYLVLLYRLDTASLKSKGVLP